MVNTGPHTNGGQFYITLDENEVTRQMDGKNVVFGYVKDRKSQKVLHLIEKFGDYEDSPHHLGEHDIVIKSCYILNT